MNEFQMFIFGMIVGGTLVTIIWDRTLSKQIRELQAEINAFKSEREARP